MCRGQKRAVRSEEESGEEKKREGESRDEKRDYQGLADQCQEKRDEVPETVSIFVKRVDEESTDCEGWFVGKRMVFSLGCVIVRLRGGLLFHSRAEISTSETKQATL